MAARWLSAATVFLAAWSIPETAGQVKMSRRGCYHHPEEGGTIYPFMEEDLFKTKNISMSDYKGQVSHIRDSI